MKTRNKNCAPCKMGVVSRECIYTSTRDGSGLVPWVDAVRARQAKQKAEASVM